MSMWSEAPRLAGPPNTKDVSVMSAYVKDLANTVAKMAKDLEFILNGNVAFDNIRADGIEARNIKAEAITTDKLEAGAVTAEKITVEELSAISANLGHIVAGLIESVEIFGAYIATRRNAYPRCEMSATGNVFGAYNDANNHIDIEPNYASSPAISFTVAGTQRGRIHNLLGYPILEGLNSVGIESRGIIYLNAPVIQVQSWSNLYSNDMGRSLGDELREAFDRIEALEGG